MVLGFDVIKSKALNVLKSKADSWDNRPDRGMDAIGSTSEGLVPMSTISYVDCYDISKHSDTLMTIQNALIQEIFRNGGEFEERWIKKCPTCGREYENEVQPRTSKITGKEVYICEEEGCGGLLVDPDYNEIKEIKPLFEDQQGVNENGQLLSEVCEQLERDMDTVDICFLVLNKEYFWNAQGQKIAATVKELIRGDPVLFRLIADKTGRLGFDDDGREAKICLEHREEVQYSDKCGKCGKQTFRACYVAANFQQEKLYYTNDEVFHTTKYTKSLTYGWPMIIPIYQKALSLMYMDSMVLDWYKGRKPPRGLLMVATRSWDALTKAWNWLLKKQETNPNMIFPFGVDTPSGQSGKIAEFINFMNNFEEMQYTQTREEMRRTIGAAYGVMPIFEGDTSSSGGLNNEGLQVTVTTRAALKGQDPFNKKLFPWLMKQFGVSDFNYLLNSPEEKDEMAEKQRFQIDVQSAQAMKQMGFDVKYVDGEFEYSGEAQDMDNNFLTGVMGGPQQMGGPPPPPDMTGQDDGAPASFGKSEKLKKKLDLGPGGHERDGTGPHGQGAGPGKGEADCIEKSIIEEISEVEKSVDQNLIMKADDLTDFLKKSIYNLTFKSMNVKQSNNIKDFLIKSIGQKVGMEEIIKHIMKTGDVDRSRAETIARTEYISVLKNKAREWSYEKADPEGRYRYVWQGPKDKRTTEVCKKISRRARNGVKLETLKKIIKEEAQPGIYEENRPYTPHLNCRHRLIRKI